MLMIYICSEVAGMAPTQVDHSAGRPSASEVVLSDLSHPVRRQSLLHQPHSTKTGISFATDLQLHSKYRILLVRDTKERNEIPTSNASLFVNPNKYSTLGTMGL